LIVRQKAFNRIAKELQEVDLMSNVYVDMLATYLDVYVSYQEFTEIIGKEGFVIE